MRQFIFRTHLAYTVSCLFFSVVLWLYSQKLQKETQIPITLFSAPLQGSSSYNMACKRLACLMVSSAYRDLWGSLGFANWLAAVVACGKPRQGQDVLKFAVTGDMPEHPCPKPIEYILRLVERVTESSETILDPFLGSGTTLVAAELLGRRGIGIEIEPKYFDLALRRVEAATKQARLEFESRPVPKQLRIEEAAHEGS